MKRRSHHRSRRYPEIPAPSSWEFPGEGILAALDDRRACVPETWRVTARLCTACGATISPGETVYRLPGPSGDLAYLCFSCGKAWQWTVGAEDPADVGPPALYTVDSVAQRIATMDELERKAILHG